MSHRHQSNAAWHEDADRLLEFRIRRCIAGEPLHINGFIVERVTAAGFIVMDSGGTVYRYGMATGRGNGASSKTVEDAVLRHIRTGKPQRRSDASEVA